MDAVAGKVSLRVQELNVHLESKTKDNVFVIVKVSVQYQAIREKIYNAFYVLSDVQVQMQAYVFDVVRAALCTMTLDHAFESKDKISDNLKSHLQDIMTMYGFTILNALVTDLAPNSKVRDAMNEINASKRLKEAAYQRAEGEKIVKVKRAEAEAESMYLSGVGVAKSRMAIMDGLRESIKDFSGNVNGTNSKDVMDLLVLTQYFDTLQEIGHNAGTKCIFLPNDNQPLRNGIMQADCAN
jgi:regulator of protease activity HflC (stomatin/prohibitin superfamily)